MYELMQHLLAFKYACKINHWSTDDYAQHLLFDRLADGIDVHVDGIAEKYFMASDNKKVFKSDILNPKMIDKNLVKMCESIIEHLEELQDDDDLNEGLGSLLSAIEEDFLNRLALAKLK
ncbi:MAG: hypothetical protein K2L95_00865 [Alphaproteobacteria bacterium]|nr:hypothetical protein [Alphaproteobacteria bacterium]MDE6570757.1 hypothetical protein [Alphaproteobacteria bacterium]